MDTDIPQKKNLISFIKTNANTLALTALILVLFFAVYIWIDNNN